MANLDIIDKSYIHILTDFWGLTKLGGGATGTLVEEVIFERDVTSLDDELFRVWDSYENENNIY